MPSRNRTGIAASGYASNLRHAECRLIGPLREILIVCTEDYLLVADLVRVRKPACGLDSPGSDRIVNLTIFNISIHNICFC